MGGLKPLLGYFTVISDQIRTNKLFESVALQHFQKVCSGSLLLLGLTQKDLKP